jgi:FAD/FMN-containing dehydrogenase
MNDSLNTNQLQQLYDICGADRVLSDPESRRLYGLDRTTLWQPAPCAIVLPISIEEIQTLVRYANRENLAIVPSGGRTGLSGGAVANNGELVLAMDRMNRILDYDPVDQTIHCEAGVLTEHIQDYAQQLGCYYPVDFAATGSSQIGGNVATNAGGISVIRYGMTRDWVLGLTVVTGASEILNLNLGLRKNNTGYDFRHLFIGSEGTLGIICEVMLRLAPLPANRLVQVLGLNNFQDILEILKIYNENLPVSAFEFFTDLALDKVIAHNKASAPLSVRTPFYVLVEIEQNNDNSLDSALEVFEQCNDADLLTDGVISQSEQQAQKLWLLREAISESVSLTKPYKNDISVRVSRMPEFIEAIETLVDSKYPTLEVIWFGHIGDGNLHLNILKPDDLPTETFNKHCEGVSIDVAELVAVYGGSISAEHGVGLLKKDLLRYSRSDEEIALMRQIKKVFDPNGIMNPGKIF